MYICKCMCVFPGQEKKLLLLQNADSRLTNVKISIFFQTKYMVALWSAGIRTNLFLKTKGFLTIFEPMCHVGLKF